MEYQFPQKFCVHLNVGITEQHQVHCPPFHAFAAHILHLLVGSNQSLSNFCIHCKTYSDVRLYDLVSTVSILLHQSYHFNYKVCICNAYQHIAHVYM